MKFAKGTPGMTSSMANFSNPRRMLARGSPQMA